MADKPKPKPTTASIFANAASAKSFAAGQAGAHTTAVTCQSCGAPRRDGDESLVCSFCGGHMTKAKPAEEGQ